MKKACLFLWLCVCCALLGGCGGGQEIESCLFVLSMAVDPAPDGNLTVTIKALSGTQEAAAGTAGASAQSSSAAQQSPPPENGGAESPEPGYIVMSATAPSCLRALNMLSSTTPRNVNLSQLREIVVSRMLAETDATLSILREIHSMYRANGEAIVVVHRMTQAISSAASAPFWAFDCRSIWKCSLITSPRWIPFQPMRSSPP